ncbi:stage II sporulation protein P [Priestia koreensis]|nr:stage II sporulation protein P [Priestia koreensis]
MKYPNAGKVNGLKSNMKLVNLLIVFTIASFLLISLLASPLLKTDMASSTMYKFLSKYKTEAMMYVLGSENPYFLQGLDKPVKMPSLSSTALQLATNIHITDVRTLLGNELPGFSFYDSEILAGEGLHYTEFPIESAPPLDVVLKERAEVSKEVAEWNKESEKPSPGPAISGRKVYIYHTHSWESYLPLLGLTGDPNENKAVDAKTNISSLGNLLAKKLNANGIGTINDQTNVGTKLNEKKWGTSKAYAVSREMVQEAMAKNKSLDFFLDFHRDALRKKSTTTTVNGKSYAQIVFVVGEENPNFEKNKQFANDLHKRLEEKYPGVSKGVLGKKGKKVNGIYNQDLSPNSIVVELGGVDNTAAELQNTIDAFADIFSDYFFKAEKVNG